MSSARRFESAEELAAALSAALDAAPEGNGDSGSDGGSKSPARTTTRGAPAAGSDAEAAERQAEERAAVVRAYREAAAVIGPFEPQTLRLAEDERSRAEVIAEDCATAGDSRWMLRMGPRREALARLVSEGRLAATVAASPLPEDPYRRLLEDLLPAASGSDGLTVKTLSLRGRSVEELRQLRQVLVWLDGLMPLPWSQDQVVEALERRRLSEPFHALTGDRFEGREKELDRLRDYVGLFEASSFRESFSRAYEGLFDRWGRLPMAIWGPGGIGKSTLMARFILDHAEVEGERRVPYAYLDFDNRSYDPLAPETLLVGIALQLAQQFPDLIDGSRAADWRNRLRHGRRGGSRQRPRGLVQVRSDRRLVRDLSRTLRAWLQTLARRRDTSEPRPFLVVLDTFEEVQIGGEGRERAAADFVALLRDLSERTRIVVCGRAKPRFVKVRDFELEGLSEPEGRRVLENLGIASAKLRDAIVDRVGTVPLSLELAARAVLASGLGEEALADLRTRSLLLQRIDQAELQGQLYDRVLKHVQNLEVRKLAHPGLVVRRLTPRVIAEVLAEPCGLDPARAGELFEALRHEVSLVEELADGSLRHRPDVRRIMLRNMLKSRVHRGTIEAIHRKAVEHFGGQEGPLARAEEAYHRMMLGHPAEVLDQIDLSDVERRSLEEAWEEPLPAGARAWLATVLGRAGEGIDWSLVDLDAWERQAANRAGQLLEAGAPERALEVLRERPDRSPGSPLPALEAQALAVGGRHDEAARVIDRALEAADEAGLPAAALDLTLVGARTALAAGASRRALELVELGLELASQGEEVARLELLELRRAARRQAGGSEQGEEEELAAAFLQASESSLLEDTDLAGQIVHQIGGSRPEVLEKAVRVLRPVDPGKLGAEGVAEILEEASRAESFESRRGEILRDLGIEETEVNWVEAARKSIDLGSMDKALAYALRYGGLGERHLAGVKKIVTSGSGAPGGPPFKPRRH